MISTGDFEVVQGNPAKPSSRFPAPPSDRPRVFQRSSSDEDRTLLMPAKLRSTIAPPRPSTAPPSPAPASVRPVPVPSLKGLVRQRQDSEDRTILRPMSPIPAPSAPPRAASASPAMMPTPYMPFKPPSVAPPALPKKASAPPPINAKGGSDSKKNAGDSDARLEVPAAVITQRTRIVPRKPSVSWAAALVALGVFTGLVTAVVARGDADSLLDATASLVDPTAPRHATPTPGAQMPAAIVAMPASTGASTLPAGAATACGDSPVTPQPMAANVSAPIVNTPAVAAAAPTQVAKPEAPKPPPVAWAAPRAYAPPAAAPAPKPAAAPAPQPQAVAAAPKPAAPKAPAAAPAPKGGGSEMESAAAADALAKAQLEASLR